MARIVRYGADAGPVAVYFHGLPGAPEECAAFDAVARERGVRLIGVDRGTFAPRLDGEPYFKALAAEIATLAEGGPVHLLGFSLGAFAALRTAPHLGGQAVSVDLIAAAAPLELGDFLPGMAGRPVFTLARRSPAMLGLMSTLQGWMAARSPAQIFGMLFATAAGGDRRLAEDPAFQAMVGEVLRLSLGPGLRGYLRDVRAYVRPWAERLPAVGAEAWIWHGADDNWTPPAMAEALQRALPAVRQLEIAPGLSHYSTLFHAMPRILERIGGGCG